MRKIFWENPYQHHLKTKVASVNKNRVLFEETIAFSFSGGQESDKAYIDGIPVIHSDIDGVYIYYTLPEDHSFLPGSSVVMEIDWERRYRLMRLHFSAELILELITKEFDLKKIGAHIAEEKACYTMHDYCLDKLHYGHWIRSSFYIRSKIKPSRRCFKASRLL